MESKSSNVRPYREDAKMYDHIQLPWVFCCSKYEASFSETSV